MRCFTTLPHANFSIMLTGSHIRIIRCSILSRCISFSALCLIKSAQSPLTHWACMPYSQLAMQPESPYMRKPFQATSGTRWTTSWSRAITHPDLFLHYSSLVRQNGSYLLGMPKKSGRKYIFQKSYVPLLMSD